MLMAGNDYERMGELIARYHERSPQVVDLDRVLARADAPAFAPTFGEVLRAAWTREGMLRRVLVDRLMPELGLRGEARGRFDERLHEVEVGAHPARQVSRRLLGALDRILPGVGARSRPCQMRRPPGRRPRRRRRLRGRAASPVASTMRQTCTTRISMSRRPSRRSTRCFRPTDLAGGREPEVVEPPPDCRLADLEQFGEIDRVRAGAGRLGPHGVLGHEQLGREPVRLALERILHRRDRRIGHPAEHGTGGAGRAAAQGARPHARP